MLTGRHDIYLPMYFRFFSLFKKLLLNLAMFRESTEPRKLKKRSTTNSFRYKEHSRRIISWHFDLSTVYSICFSAILCFLTLLTILSTIYDYSNSSGKQTQKLITSILRCWKFSYFWLLTNLNSFYVHLLMNT